MPTIKARALRCVVDASVAFKRFVPEPDSARAIALFDALIHKESQFHVPDLFFVEMANVFWTSVRRGRINEDEAREGIADLIALGLTSHALPALVVDALDISLARQVPVYDASYVALAAQLRLPLITADDKLQRKLGDRFDVRLLSEFTW